MNESFSLGYALEFGISVKGIIHLGGHHGQEAHIYDRLKVPVVWVEAHPEYFNVLAENIQGWPDQRAYQACISDVDGEEVDFFITADEYASSILRPAYHQIQNPHAYLTGSIKLPTKRFDTFINQYNIDLNQFNFLVLDIQGAEMKALKSMGDMLDSFDIVATEYSTVEFYEGVPHLNDIANHLHEFDKVYPRNEAETLIHGDALFIRRLVDQNEARGILGQ